MPSNNLRYRSVVELAAHRQVAVVVLVVGVGNMAVVVPDNTALVVHTLVVVAGSTVVVGIAEQSSTGLQCARTGSGRTGSRSIVQRTSDSVIDQYSANYKSA